MILFATLALCALLTARLIYRYDLYELGPAAEDGTPPDRRALRRGARIREHLGALLDAELARSEETAPDRAPEVPSRVRDALRALGYAE